MQDTTQLVNRFIATEDENFSLFNYVNEFNTEIEQVSDQVWLVSFASFFSFPSPEAFPLQLCHL